MNPVKQNRRTLWVLSGVAVLMFGFGFALIPLYDFICDITGLNGKTGRTDVASVAQAEVDESRWVTVEFMGHSNSGLPWTFKPTQAKLRVHPGITTLATYRVTNTAQETITGQAVPSVVPNQAAPHFKKIECFCFTQQTLAPGETRDMPVRFVVNSKLSKRVDTITLSYAFFNTDKASARKYSSDPVVVEHDQEMDHSLHTQHGG